MCRVDASKNQIALVFSDVNLSASVRFYVRVDVFAGVWRFSRRRGSIFIQRTGEETCFFSLLFFLIFLVSLSLSLGSSFCHDDNKKNKKILSSEEEKKKKHTISVSHDVSNEKGRR